MPSAPGFRWLSGHPVGPDREILLIARRVSTRLRTTHDEVVPSDNYDHKWRHPMNRVLVVVAMVALCLTVTSAQVRVAAKYNYPLLPGSATDSLLNGLSSIRGCAFDQDADGDGKPEIAVTNYNGLGRVHVFKVLNSDSIQLVWTSPRVTSGGGSSTPRSVIFGDLDNDGKKEVIYQSNLNGIYIFEWDGVVGSGNFGTLPSQLITSPDISGTGGNCEYMECLDIDADAQNELLVAYNSSPNANDKYYIISSNGDWNTNDPGFSSFNVEFQGARPSLGTYGLSNGSPMAMISANFDGTGNREVLIHGWDRKAVTVMRVPSPNTYLLADTTHGKQFLNLSAPDDHVALFGGMAYDIDRDGRDEVYLPTWYGSAGGSHAGFVHMICFNQGSSPTEIDSIANVVAFDLTSVIGVPTGGGSGYNANLLGFGYGDVEGTGKRHLYFSGIDFGSSGFNVVSMEFQGGDKRIQANWKTSILYRADLAVDSALTIRDSVGRVDTTRTIWAAQVSKMVARALDFDKDGKEEMFLPYQGWCMNPDSIAITKLKWNTGTNRYDTTKSKIPNPNRWSFRILKRGGATGVEAKDLTVITPDDYRLDQNYPNPFNPSTTISFYLPVRQSVSLRVFDIVGREVKTLMRNEERGAGIGKVVWDGTNNNGKPVASVPYVYTLTFGNFSKSEKMMLLR